LGALLLVGSAACAVLLYMDQTARKWGAEQVIGTASADD
jgi:hypothetical protein